MLDPFDNRSKWREWTHRQSLLAPASGHIYLKMNKARGCKTRQALRYQGLGEARGDSREMVSHMVWLRVKTYLMLNCDVALCRWSTGPRMVVTHLREHLGLRLR